MVRSTLLALVALLIAPKTSIGDMTFTIPLDRSAYLDFYSAPDGNFNGGADFSYIFVRHRFTHPQNLRTQIGFDATSVRDFLISNPGSQILTAQVDFPVGALPEPSWRVASDWDSGAAPTFGLNLANDSIDNWNPATITPNNSLYNTFTGDWAGSSRNMVGTSVATLDITFGDVLSIASTQLASGIEQDPNGYLTFMFESLDTRVFNAPWANSPQFFPATLYVTVSAVPEPSSLALAGIGFVACALLIGRRAALFSKEPS
jgi:hypothetical protein